MTKRPFTKYLQIFLLLVIISVTYKMLKWCNIPGMQVDTKLIIKIAHKNNREPKDPVPVLAGFKLVLRGGNLRSNWKYDTDKNVSDSIDNYIFPKICDEPTVEQLLRPCKQFLGWDKRQKKGNNWLLRTHTKNSLVTVSIYKSVLTNLHVGKVYIETFDRRGSKKKQGGDSWRSIITGREQQVSVQLNDLSDGSYQGWFLLLYPGQFALEIVLENSLCEGITDPPLDWFQRGTFIFIHVINLLFRLMPIWEIWYGPGA